MAHTSYSLATPSIPREAAPAAFGELRHAPLPLDGLPTWKSSELLQGAREALIQHEGSVYRLRLTALGKLILTK